MVNNTLTSPNPIVNNKEEKTLISLTERYNKLLKPGILTKAGTKIGGLIPEKIKELGNTAKETITEAELFEQCMKVIVEGFNILEKQAAKMSISETAIVKKINKTLDDNEITTLKEVCLARSYDISQIVSTYKMQDIGLAFAEGGITGWFGFPGLPFNLVLSTFLYYRAVQSIAMFYGYDVKNDAAELMIASEVFMSALNPGDTTNYDEIGSIIGKVMVITELTAVKQATNKTWSEIAKHGGVGLFLTQLRALAHKSAQKALEKAGQKGLENSLFSEIFEQIGKKLTKKALGKAVPVAGAVIGALFDTAQMNKILEYADVFYNKRYILEKKERVNDLLGISKNIIVEDFIIEE